jgi:hypothetical protein
MNTTSEVVIVSVFGRGNWLAVELKNLGLDVTLVDVTEAMGRWAPEDWEGPFGLFLSDELTQSQRTRLDEEDYSDSVDEGFTFWFKSGPLDFRGSHSQYLLDKREISKESLEYINNYQKLLAKRRSELMNQFSKESFSENWFVNLAHSVASPTYAAHYESFQFGEPLALSAPYNIRRVTRKGLSKSLEWVASHKIQLFEKAKVNDISTQRNKVDNLEIESLQSGILAATQFVWMLSSQETERLNPKLRKSLFSTEVLKPSWAWLRYRIDLQNFEATNILPLKLALIEDLALPWAHENLQLVQKTTSKENMDVWVRIPEVHRFQKKYIEEIGNRILEIWVNRIPGVSPKILEFPQEYNYDESTLGPARFVQFDPDALKSLKRVAYQNMHYDSAELWQSLDWLGQFRNQNKIFESIKAWKLERDRERERENEKKLRESKNN